MPTIRQQERLLGFKIVYYGPADSGRSTNLRCIHGSIDPASRSELHTTAFAADRTLGFDFRSHESPSLPGYKTMFQFRTVPGAVTYNATLQLLLRQADAVVFVADSQMDRQRDNLQAWQHLDATLRLMGSSIERLPVVLQYNKRDLPNAAPVDYLEFLLNNRANRFTSFEAEAKSGRNVLATLNAVTQSMLAQFHQRITEERAAAEEPEAFDEFDTARPPQTATPSDGFGADQLNAAA